MSAITRAPWLPPKTRSCSDTGNPVRPAVIAAAATPYPPLDNGGPLQLLVFGGSQGARLMAEMVPPSHRRARPPFADAVEDRAAGPDADLPRVRRHLRKAVVARRHRPFFMDQPALMAASHLVIARSGASTVSEVARGRPAGASLSRYPTRSTRTASVPTPTRRWPAGERAPRGVRLEYAPELLATEIAALAGTPSRLAPMAAAAKAAGRSTPPSASPIWCEGGGSIRRRNCPATKLLMKLPRDIGPSISSASAASA